MKTITAAAAAAWAWVGAQLMKHWLLVFAAVLTMLAFLVLFSGKKSQDAKNTVEQAVQADVLSKKEVKQKEKVIAATLDSIRSQTIIIRKVVHVRDSAIVAANHHEAKADSLIKALPDEDYTSPSTATARVESFLSGYHAQAYARPGADSLK
jgi:delta 1-pyrroline-5-carboxylate dehydrogenase